MAAFALVGEEDGAAVVEFDDGGDGEAQMGRVMRRTARAKVKSKRRLMRSSAMGGGG